MNKAEWQRNASFVFVRKLHEGAYEYAFVQEMDPHRRYYGKYVPVHRRARNGETAHNAAQRAVGNENELRGKIVPGVYASEDRGDVVFHYYVADFTRMQENSKKHPKWFSEEQIKEYERNSIADWVPEIMERMRLIV